MHPILVYAMRLSTFKGAKMRLFKAMVLGVLLLPPLIGRGTFHIHQPYDTDSDGQFETLVLNTRTFSAIWVEISPNDDMNDTLWTFQLPQGGTFADGEIVDLNGDQQPELVLIPDLFAAIGDQVWFYVFLGNEEGFSKTPLTIDSSLLEAATIRPSNLALVPGHSAKLAVSFGAPVRHGMIFDIQIENESISLINNQVLTAPIISNGYGPVYIGGFTSNGGHYMAVVSPEGNQLKTAIFDIEQGYALTQSKQMSLNNARYLLGADIQMFQSKDTNIDGLLLPFASDDIFLLSLDIKGLKFSNTSLSGQGVFPSLDDGDLHSVINSRQKAEILESQIFANDYLQSRKEKETLQPPDPVAVEKTPPPISIKIKNKRDWTSKPTGDERYNKKSSASEGQNDFSMLSPTLGDFLESVKDELIESSKSEKEKTTIPIMNEDMQSVNWADEAGFTQLELGEYVPEAKDSVIVQSPIPNKDTGIAAFTKEALIDSLNPIVVNEDTLIEYDNINKIDLYYVLALTPVSSTRDRYVFDGEAPFGVAVNQIPSMGNATHLQHGISADLATLERGETYDFAYSLRDARLDSITTLTMVHDMQTNVVFMSISPTDDSLSQSYQPESFDPKMFEFPDYFFEGFPTSLDMDFTDKIIRFSFDEDKDSTYQGIYLSSTTPSKPSQSLAVFMDQGTLQSVRGEVVVRANGSKKVTTEYDLVGAVEPAVLFSRLIQEMFPEELKVKLLQGASLEEPLFGPSGKMPKITREPRLPDAQPDQADPEIPIEPKQSNVPEEKSDSLKINHDIEIETPGTQKDELTPSIPEVEKREQPLKSMPTDSLKLEVAKDIKEPETELTPSAPEESQPEQESQVKEDKKESEAELTPSAPEESEPEQESQVKEDGKL